jgi:cupin 2 domain-containing protein
MRRDRPVSEHACVGNLFADIPSDLPSELTEVLLRSDDARVERIVSRGHRSADGFWYEQDEDELVVLFEGEATLEIEGESPPRSLSRGDWLLLPAGRRHRVSWTAPDRDTIWLAVFTPPR